MIQKWKIMEFRSSGLALEESAILRNSLPFGITFFFELSIFQVLLLAKDHDCLHPVHLMYDTCFRHSPIILHYKVD